MTGARNARPKSAEVTRRRKRVIELRDEGMTFREIAEELGVSVKLVHDDYKKTMAEIPVEAVETYRRHQQDELAMARAVVEDILAARHVTISATGQVVYEGNDIVRDHGPILAAVDRLMKISDREAKLLGLDARPELTVTGNLTYEFVGLDKPLPPEAHDA